MSYLRDAAKAVGKGSLMKIQIVLFLAIFGVVANVLGENGWTAKCGAGSDPRETSDSDAAQHSIDALEAIGIKAHSPWPRQSGLVVEFGSRAISDEIFQHLSKLPDFQMQMKVPGANFQRLDDLPNLKSLSVGDPSMTDKDLRAMDGVKSVSELILDRSTVSDAGLADLKELPGLVKLSLSHTQITDRGLEVLARMPNLESVSLGRIALGAQSDKAPRIGSQ